MARTPRKMFDPGEFRERVEIWRDLVGRTPGGGIKKDLQPWQSAWANVQELSSKSAIEAGAAESKGMVIFVVRYRTDLKETDIIVWENNQHTQLKFRMLGNREKLEITAIRQGPHRVDY